MADNEPATAQQPYKKQSGEHLERRQQRPHRRGRRPSRRAQHSTSAASLGPVTCPRSASDGGPVQPHAPRKTRRHPLCRRPHPPWAIICHHGRRTGRRYRTPVNAYKHGRTLAVVILYGEQSDWVQNLLAGGGQVVRAGHTYELLNPRLTDPSEAQDISRLARHLGRLSQKLLVAELGKPLGGFGRGPLE